MSFYDILQQQTTGERQFLHTAPVISRCLAGEVSRETYLDFLTQAYHHVRHTVPLMMGVGSRLSARHDWLRAPIMHYLEEEQGHERWILQDIEAAGGDARAAEVSKPAIETDAMVAYAYDTVMRRNPVGFFGMVFVLEGTSAALALTAADRIQSCLDLPDKAFTYLRSHGRLDQEHVQHLAEILERLDSQLDHPAVIDCARAMYWLYGNVFRGLKSSSANTSVSTGQSRCT